MRDWINDPESLQCSLYEFGLGGLVEFFINETLLMVIANPQSTLHEYGVLSMALLDIEDLGERLVGEARENYSVLL